MTTTLVVAQMADNAFAPTQPAQGVVRGTGRVIQTQCCPIKSRIDSIAYRTRRPRTRQ